MGCLVIGLLHLFVRAEKKLQTEERFWIGIAFLVAGVLNCRLNQGHN